MLVLVLAVVGTVTFVNLSTSGAAGSPTSAATTAGRTAKPAPRPFVPTASVASSFTGWGVDARGDTGTRFAAETGDAEKGKMALVVSSTTASSSPHAALRQTIAVAPSTSYELGIWVRAAGEGASGLTVQTDDTRTTEHALAGSNGRWVQRTWSVRTGAAQTALNLAVVPDRPIESVGIDEVTLAAKGSPAPVANGGFEQFDAGHSGLTNRSLIFTTGQAALGVSLPTESVEWSIADTGAKPVASGSASLASHLGIIPLTSLKQGFYSVAIRQKGAATPTLSTTFMVLDPTPDGKPVLDQRLGVTVHPTIEPYQGYEPLVAALGYGEVRMDATWSAIEKTKGVYTFSPESDATYARLAADGVSVLPIIDYRNKLYEGGRTPSTDAGIAAFAAFAAAVQAHYHQPAIEIYNEFNNPPMNNSRCGLTAACYMPLLEKAAAAVRSVDPSTTIVGPAIAHKDDAWLTEFYRLGGLKTVDAVSFHPYDSLGAPEYLDGSLKQAQSRIAEYSAGASPRPIWLTELGWTNFVTPRPDQADFLVRAEVLGMAHGVSKFFWYDLVDHTTANDIQGNFGLFSAPTAQIPAFAPKQAAMAQAVLARELAAKRYIGRDELGDTTYSYRFGRGDGTTRVLWATKPATVQVSAKSPVTVTNSYGVRTVLKPSKGVVSIPLTGLPVYLSGDLPAPKPAAKG
ncbi:glycosyl hydrolase [Leifsonia sp. NPDC077715]|uniref:glycosyl hydrolase n=1 Tax=Leifsonia sp. NPDC077715 TaxID=3155539 RepID=UPI0034165FAC